MPRHEANIGRAYQQTASYAVPRDVKAVGNNESSNTKGMSLTYVGAAITPNMARIPPKMPNHGVTELSLPAAGSSKYRTSVLPSAVFTCCMKALSVAASTHSFQPTA